MPEVTVDVAEIVVTGLVDRVAASKAGDLQYVRLLGIGSSVLVIVPVSTPPAIQAGLHYRFTCDMRQGQQGSSLWARAVELLREGKA